MARPYDPFRAVPPASVLSARLDKLKEQVRRLEILLDTAERIDNDKQSLRCEVTHAK